jgi:uncharacterized protein YfaA (DUF2138 family)
MLRVPEGGRNGAANVFLSPIYRQSLEDDISVWSSSKVWTATPVSAWRRVALPVSIGIKASTLSSGRS